MSYCLSQCYFSLLLTEPMIIYGQYVQDPDEHMGMHFLCNAFENDNELYLKYFCWLTNSAIIWLAIKLLYEDFMREAGT